MKQLTINYLILTIGIFGLLSCVGGSESDSSAPPPKSKVANSENEDPMQNKGIGPVKSLTLPDEIDQVMATEGAEIYKTFCSACHKPDVKFIGPAPKGIFDRRSPEWVMNMILNPEEMVKEDPIAKKLLVEYNMAPMANQNLNEDQARKILEYFRTIYSL